MKCHFCQKSKEDILKFMLESVESDFESRKSREESRNQSLQYSKETFIKVTSGLESLYSKLPASLKMLRLSDLKKAKPEALDEILNEFHTYIQTNYSMYQMKDLQISEVYSEIINSKEKQLKDLENNILTTDFEPEKKLRMQEVESECNSLIFQEYLTSLGKNLPKMKIHICPVCTKYFETHSGVTDY